MEIRTDFCGGNLSVLSVDGDRVHVAVELRDTNDDWFYWAFRVVGAAGRTLTFDFAPKNWVGCFGAAVSHDLASWSWTNTASGDCRSFTYTFAEGEDDVCFAHDMLYHPSRFYRFAERRGLRVECAATDRGGSPIPSLTVGDGSRTILLTARHHCCEATGDYVMEGIIDEYLANPLPDSRIVAIPFVDADGVVAGDQGKNRAPHDHNRDYLEHIYPGTRAVREVLERGDVFAAFDLHSPWHFSGRNDKVFVVRKSFERLDDLKLFGKCFEAEITEGAMKYSSENDIDPDVEWNKVGPPVSCSKAAGEYAGVELSCTLETTYFGEVGNIVSQEKLVETGRCFYRGFLRYLREKNIK